MSFRSGKSVKKYAKVKIIKVSPTERWIERYRKLAPNVKDNIIYQKVELKKIKYLKYETLISFRKEENMQKYQRNCCLKKL